MSVLPILAWPDPRLKRRCAPVERIDDAVRKLISDMFETMYDAPGRGLAAPQVGVMQRLFVMDATWKEGTKTPLVCINPEIKPLGDETSTNEEACLSIKGVAANVTRPNQIELTFTDDALVAIAEKAIKRKTGASGLRSIVESILLDTMFDLPSMDGVSEVVVDDDVVQGRKEPVRVVSNDDEKNKEAAA